MKLIRLYTFFNSIRKMNTNVVAEKIHHLFLYSCKYPSILKVYLHFPTHFLVDNILQVLYTLSVLSVLIQLERRRDHDFD